MRRSSGGRLAMVFAGLSLIGAGCDLNDRVVRWDFNLKRFGPQPDAMTVLRTSTDGDDRAKAMFELKEPKRNGGGDAVQEEAIQVLTDAATNDPRALCRIAGIGALGRFEDPRSIRLLVAAYYGASAFPSDQANSIRVAAMTALGHKRSEEGLALLARAATAPIAPATSAKSDLRLVSQKDEDVIQKLLGQSDPDAQAARDARLAAVRAMGMSRDPNAIPVLIPLLAEGDVALRDRAQEALQNITGQKNVPPTPEAWSQKLSVQAAPKA
jgi:hypothetical protein